jgi:hypothetical protein
MKIQERREVYRGHLKECLIHLDMALASKIPRGIKGTAKQRMPMAKFCEVNIQTISRWFNPDYPAPVGEVIVKLYCYLDMIGYRVMEFEKLSKDFPGRGKMVELIGYGVMTFQEAATTLGYSLPKNLSQILQCRAGTTKEKDQMMWDLWKSHREALERHKSRAQKLFTIDIPETSSAPGDTMRFSAVLKIMDGLDGLLEETSLQTSLLGYLIKCPSSHEHVALVTRLAARMSTLRSELDENGGGRGAHHG